MSSILWIDVESSGLGQNAATIEIALIPVINGEKHPPFVSYIKPHIGATLDPKAFEINKINQKEIWNFPDAEEVVQKIIEFVDSHETVFKIGGHNVQYDRGHLFRLFCRTANYSNFTTRFSPDDLCTLSVARRIFKNKRKKPDSFKLGELCKYFDIVLENAHSALPDLEATIQVYDRLCSLDQTEKPTPRTLTYQEQRAKYMAIDYLTVNPEGDAYIHCKAMKDPEAMRFILNELWRITQCQEVIS